MAEKNGRVMRGLTWITEMSPRASFHLVAEENGRVMHELTWILLGRLGGGITKHRDVAMGIDSIRLG